MVILFYIAIENKSLLTVFLCSCSFFRFSFVLGMSHQIILVSFGAFTILMFLIKDGSVSKTTTLFFLVPPTSAVMAFIFIDENLTTIDILGLIIATIGVYIATREKN